MGNLEAMWVRSSSAAAVAPGMSTTAASGRSLHRGCGTPITARLAHGRVAHQRILERLPCDPLAAALDQICDAVGELYEAVLVRTA